MDDYKIIVEQEHQTVMAHYDVMPKAAKRQIDYVHLTSSKILSLDNKNKKLIFVLYCSRLFVSL